MLGFLGRRVAMLLVSLLLASIAIYAALDLAPGSPVSALSGGRSLSPESVQLLERRYHLDDPFFARYWDWLQGAAQGDFGVSIVLRADVSELIGERIGTTLLLVGMAAAIIVLAGLALGLLGALRPGWVDDTTLVLVSILAGVPSFVAALALIAIFAVELGWLPALGSGEGLGDELRHLILPAFALAASSLGLVARVTRAAVREEMAREHVTTATSRGIPRRLVVTRHVLRNAAIPVTTVVGLTIASLIALASVVETAFSLDGLGSALVDAAGSKDLPVVQGIALLLVAAFVVANTIVDLLYASLDPRVRIGRRAS